MSMYWRINTLISRSPNWSKKPAREMAVTRIRDDV